MTIGIVGSGRMGQDLFYSLIGYECRVILVSKNPEQIDKITKRTQKILKRDPQLMGKETPVITDSLYDLADCDVVIETVIENLSVKQEMFQRLGEIVKNTCIFATNSSSLDVTGVFYYEKAKERCLGLHFFYPLKLISTAEVNAGPDTSEETVKEMVRFLSMTERKPLVLRGENRLVLSKLLISLAAYTYKLSLEGELTLKELDQITKQVLLFGIFEMVDSTGFPIISQCLANLPDKLHSVLYQPLLLKVTELMKQGKDGRRGEGLLSLEDIGKKDTAGIENREECYEVYGVRFLSFLLNEAARYMKDPLLDKKQFQESVQEVLGLSASLKFLYKELKEKMLLETLMAEYEKTLDPLLLPADFKVYRER
ncbi:3-hydroxyacyl-CoA dehydrogenase family protein [Clostridium boliviensis]|uniref:3-hydroxyacyl-CoA dehydrogenase family protein n=1 Tax=Clostridium boliviensis TaxID=318465 RepID=A0ABU4GKA7_9CLOT|nr:3-hydroxyacyl-CoA dehydrogenase family protein [Clostridium boliviensis]MDW2798056.1 3-hydroxyacyl-CoA dehydrogenase family protein [Clostridium boliviensis]